ncbi:MAG: hypothetical protein KBE65_08785 [Phycisphaerae bacterium]|nr:hypothetical protein [Phycisphaerae bacterium]
MDDIESIGMPLSLPQAAASDRMPGSVSRCLRHGSATGSSDAVSSRQRDEQERQIGRDFESVLLTKVFEQVQASIEESSFDEEDAGAGQVRGLFWFYLAQDFADKGGFGLGNDVYHYIKQMQGTDDPAGSIDEEL